MQSRGEVSVHEGVLFILRMFTVQWDNLSKGIPLIFLYYSSPSLLSHSSL